MWYQDFFSRLKASLIEGRDRTSATTLRATSEGIGVQKRLSSSKQRRLAERYRVLVENAPVCIHEIDHLRTLTAVNRAGLKMLGRTESVFGVPAISVVSPADRPRVARLMDLAFRGEFCEFEFAAPGDRTFLSCFMPLKDKHGTVHKVLGMSQDITLRRSAEERLNQAQKMEALGKLAGGIAHDFNNILNVIIGYAHLLQEEGTNRDKVGEHATEVLKAAQRATSLTRQLLAFSRKQVVQRQSLDLNTVIHGISKMLRRLIREDVEIATQFASDLPSITADVSQIEQVIVNLAINARDAMPDGGRLTIATSRADLNEGHARSLGLTAGPHAVLTVSDNGLGMNADTQAHIFEPFFTTKEPGKGTGLGLATVHAVVSQSGGHISVSSQVGAGTSFVVYFPASTTSAAVMTCLPVPRTMTSAAETILLVEDEQGLRRLMKELLRGEGYTVLEGADGLAAIQISRTYAGTIHLLLTDMVMPNMHGRHLAVQLKQQRPALKVLYMTGYADSDDLEQGGVLEKPFMPETLLRAVHDVLSSSDRVTSVRTG
ncbi:MAG TPA: ATP-binding protein [Candidatus Sulfotelmatobacter sp.]|nr:ATP-binding protein [Candidatus Sulfotelmatobacter sp.]